MTGGEAVRKAVAVADAATLFVAVTVLTMTVLASLDRQDHSALDDGAEGARGRRLGPPCEEIYAVGEGETLNSISDKCGDPFIVEQNPHVHDPDDVFPGLVLRITPSGTRSAGRIASGDHFAP